MLEELCWHLSMITPPKAPITIDEPTPSNGSITAETGFKAVPAVTDACSKRKKDSGNLIMY